MEYKKDWELGEFPLLCTHVQLHIIVRTIIIRI